MKYVKISMILTLLASLALACSDEDVDEAGSAGGTGGSAGQGGSGGAAGTAGQGGDGAPDAQALPDTFGDCGQAVCEVALSAFADHCPATLAEATTCGDAVETATCDGIAAIRTTYGFPGDYYLCLYDSDTSALVGAKWAPDSHPTQIAGTQLPDGCELMPAPCQ